MLLTQKKKRPLGVQIAVSRKAHALLHKKAFEAKPRKTIRAIINVILGIKDDE